MSSPSELAKQVKAHFDNRDFDALMRVVNQALGVRDESLDVGAQLREVQGQLGDEKLQEEFEIHVANLKNEAMKQFDQERYSDCLGTFRFLCELEPDNKTLRDYLQLCQELVPVATDNLPDEVTAGVSDATGLVCQPCEVLVATGSLAEPVLRGMSASTPMPDLNLQPLDGEEGRQVEPEGRESSKAKGHFGTQTCAPDATLTEPVTEQTKEPPYSLSLGLRLVLVAVAFLLVAILGIAYLKGPIQNWRSPQENQSNPQSTLPATSQSEKATPQLETQSLLRKAEAAAVSNRYVTPRGDNAVAYCNEVLAVNPDDTTARSLKEDSINAALIQARKSVESLKFSEAHETYSSLLDLSRHENRFPLTGQEVEKELEKLEFVVYPVVHDHLFGSCKGHLKINAYVISFVPSGDSTDGFTEPFSEVTLFGPGDRLKIEMRAKTYHFESKTGDQTNSTEQIMTIYRDLKRRISNAR